MNIEDMTIKQVREIAAIANAISGGSNAPAQVSPAVGKYCVIRTCSAGVHAGTVVSHDSDIVVLKDARRLWSWTAKSGVALSGLAINGLKVGKVDTMTPEHIIVGVIEIIPCSEAAKESINGA